MNNNLLSLLKTKYINIPLYIFKLKDKLKLDTDTFIFLMYLSSCGDNILFDLSTMSNDLGISTTELMRYIENLTNNDLMDLKVITNDKGVMEEYISLENFYNKLSVLVVDEVVNSDNHEEEKTIFDKIEQEFGRTLSPIEVEIIRGWLENNITVELIEQALKEAIFSGVTNLKYIDKILYEWGKKGFKTKSDVEEYQTRRREKKNDTKVDVFDYDWLDEE